MKQLTISLLLIPTFIIVFLSGCSNDSKSSHNNSSNPSQSSAHSFWADDVIKVTTIEENEESVYYISNIGIMKYNKKNKTKTVLVKSEFIESFCIDNNLLYFCEDETTIYRIDLNGSNLKKILNLNQVENLLVENSLGYFKVYDQYIYIKASGTSFIRYSLKTQKAEVFADDVSEYLFFDQYFYFIDHEEKSFSIFRKDLYTGKIDLLRGDGISKYEISSQQVDTYDLYDNVFVLNHQLYYTTREPAQIFRMDQSRNDILIDGFNDNEGVNYLSVYSSGYKLFYISESGTRKNHLYAYDLKTNKREELLVMDDVNYALGIKIINDVVFYYSATNKSIAYALIQ
ncbi:MAG: hypothetical protein BGN88_06990 [Clostridiales bacterium 43-6]|nr:MAG: hypothetical protein BGN88_06990 [Clostridiales bacterium 43-6]